MGQEHVGELQAPLRGLLQIEIDIPLRVDDHRTSTRVVSYQVGGVCEAPQVVLGEHESHAASLRQPYRALTRSKERSTCSLGVLSASTSATFPEGSMT